VEFLDAVPPAWTNRFVTQDPVDLAALEQAIEVARYAPQGSNRQPVHFSVVSDPDVKRQLKEWYLGPWNEYLDKARESDIAIGGQPS
jgi:nitroreductase